MRSVPLASIVVFCRQHLALVHKLHWDYKTALVVVIEESKSRTESPRAIEERDLAGFRQSTGVNTQSL